MKALITPNKKNTIRKPRLKGVASSGRGLGSIELTTPQTEVIKQTASVIPFLIKTIVIVGIAAVIIYKYKNRFIKLDYARNYDPANITDAQAEAKAAAIYNAMGLFSNSFSTVKASVAGLNYNGFIKLYNAFGTHTGRLLGFGKEMDLIAWCSDQFDENQIAQLRFLLGGAFF